VDALGNRTREDHDPKQLHKGAVGAGYVPVTVSAPAIEEALKEKALEGAGGAWRAGRGPKRTTRSCASREEVADIGHHLNQDLEHAFPEAPLALGEVRNSQTFAVSESGLMCEDTCTGYVCGEDHIGERFSIFNEGRHELVHQMGMRSTVAFEGARVSD
jgi:hypothetical protein